MRTPDVGWPVVAGVDGTTNGDQAASFAADLAQQLGRPLLLVHAYRHSPAISPLLPIAEPRASRLAVTAVAYAPYASNFNLEIMREAGTRALNDAEDRVRETHPDLKVMRKLVAGAATKALVKESRHAVAVVLVRGRESAVEHFIAGSTTSAVASHASSPVLIVPANWQGNFPPHTIAVGIEGTASEAEALRFAFDAAGRAKNDLIVLHAGRSVAPAHAKIAELVDEVAEINEAEKRVIAESLAGWAEEYPQVKVRTVFSDRRPVDALLHERSADTLLVVGARGGGGLKHLALGSTAHAVLRHAPCPVAVVRSTSVARRNALHHRHMTEPVFAGLY
jgi:nucleotide-binding universal stress UspA family protein